MDDPERDYRARFVFDVLKSSGQTEFDCLIDFGCGDGRVMKALRKLVNAKQAFGVDVDAPVDGETEPDAEAVRFCRINLLQFQPTERFDLVISNQVFEHIHEPWLVDYFAVLKDSCEPGGTILVSTPNRWRPKNIMRAVTLRSPHMMCANPGVPPEVHTGHHRECSYRELKSIFSAHFPESQWQIKIARPIPKKIGSSARWFVNLAIYYSLWLAWRPACVSASQDHYVVARHRNS